MLNCSFTSSSACIWKIRFIGKGWLTPQGSVIPRKEGAELSCQVGGRVHRGMQDRAGLQVSSYPEGTYCMAVKGRVPLAVIATLKKRNVDLNSVASSSRCSAARRCPTELNLSATFLN